MSWICTGASKDGNLSSIGSHEPFENPDDAEFCFKCELPKSSVVVASRHSNGNHQNQNSFLVFLLSAGFLLVAVGLGRFLWSDRSSGISPPLPSSGISSPLPITPSASVNPTESGFTPVISSISETSFFSTIKEVSNVPQMTVQYGGSTSFAPLRSPEIVEKIERNHPKFRLQYREPIPPKTPGSGEGIRMLIDGEISIAQSSRPLKDTEFIQAKNRGFTIKQIPVAFDGIAIYVSKDLRVSALTIDQLRDIFTGKITNWSEVGGEPIPIVPISRNPEDGGTPEYFREKILGDAMFAPSIQQSYARDTTTSIQNVSRTPGGIGYATASEVCNQKTIRALPLARSAPIKTISPCENEMPNIDVFLDDSYPITRRLFVVIRQDGTLDEQAGIAYTNILLSNEGQELIQEAGMVPLRIP